MDKQYDILKANPAKSKIDPGSLILLFMVIVYPLFVIPYNFVINYPGGAADPGFFYAPRYALLMIISLLALVLLLLRRTTLNHPATIPLLAFMLLAMIATILAPYQATAWFGVPLRYTGFSTYCCCFILFILAANNCDQEDLLSALIGGATIVSILAILQYFGLNLIAHESFREGFISYSTMGNPDFLGTYTAFILPAAVLRYLHTRGVHWLAAAALINAALVVSLCRGAWLASAIGLLLVIIYHIKRHEMIKQLLVTLLVLLVTVAALLPFRDGVILTRLGSLGKEISNSLILQKNSPSTNTEQGGQGASYKVSINQESGTFRVYIWNETLKIYRQHWLIGIGPDHLGYYNIRTPNDQVLADKAHDIYLEMAVSLGTLALLAYLVFLGMIMAGCRGKRSSIYLMMLTVYLLQGLTNIDVVMILPLFWIVLGLAVASSRERTSGSPNQSRVITVVDNRSPLPFP